MTLDWCSVDQVTVRLSHDERLGGIYGFHLESRTMRSLGFTAVCWGLWCCVESVSCLLLMFRGSGLVPYSRNQMSFFLDVLTLTDGNDVLFWSLLNIEAAQHPNWWKTSNQDSGYDTLYLIFVHNLMLTNEHWVQKIGSVPGFRWNDEEVPTELCSSVWSLAENSCFCLAR